MTDGKPQDGIRITLDDLASVQVTESIPSPVLIPAAPGSHSYGNLRDAAMPVPEIAPQRGSIFLQGWFYLGTAGLLGALAGWAICEPGFLDGRQGLHWGNLLMVPAMVAMMTLGYGVAESIVERSLQKALIRAAMALPLGLFLGFLFSFLADIVFAIGQAICGELGAQSFRNPSFWIARALAWTVFGIVGGLVYGIVGQSFKKGKWGVLGGMLGAGIGGLLFDPINMWTGATSAALSRAVGFAIVGATTGILMGVVESALKDRWLYVVSGPLAGKQFILYKPQTSIGSDQQSDIYLFKDPSILPSHALLVANGARLTVQARGPVLVSGVPVANRVLLDGDVVQIGRYSFRYKEKSRS